MGRKVILWALALLVAAPELASAKSSLAYQNYTRGVELAAKKQWTEALQKFQSAIDLNPAYVASYIEWARAAVRLGRRREGLEKLSASLAFARTGEEKSKVEKERANLSEIFYTNETFQQYQDGLNYLRLEGSSSAVEALERALKTEPDNLLVLGAYADALRAEERQKDALAVLERAFALNESNREIRVELAQSSLGQNPERTLLLLKPLADEPEQEETTWLQAQALSALKRNKEAIELLRGAYERQPSWLYAPYWLGKLYALEANGGWNARKYLMTFLKRSEVLEEKEKIEATAEIRKLRAARAEAEAILARVNRSLE
jgi:tetratricopeptide (TPR) repeat protein